MQIVNCEQNSPEWLQARRGMPTSSEFSKIITTTGKVSTQREKYMWRLAGERIGGIVEEGFISFAMQRGKDKEQSGKDLYEFIREPVTAVGFCLSDCGRWGASTDGLIAEKGVLELKCPEMGTHIGYLIGKKEIPTEYYQQTQGELLVTGRDFVDFMSFYPGIAPFLVREEPDPVFQKMLKSALVEFTDELNHLVKRLS